MSYEEGTRVKLTGVSLVQLLDLPWKMSKTMEGAPESKVTTFERLSMAYLKSDG